MVKESVLAVRPTAGQRGRDVPAIDCGAPAMDWETLHYPYTNPRKQKAQLDELG
jgi:hypothetical protein